MAIMKLTDDDYRELAAQCAVQDFGRIDRDGEMVYVRMDVYVDYDVEEYTDGHIPVCAECHVKDFDSETVDGSEVELDEYRLEEMTHEILMQY